MPFTLPDLSYAKEALEPHIDARTMEIHHDKHHQTYVTNLNNAIAGTDLDGKDIVAILKNINSVPANIKIAVQNNGGGHANHTLFWETLGADGGAPSGALADAIGRQERHRDVFGQRRAGRARQCQRRDKHREFLHELPPGKMPASCGRPSVRRASRSRRRR